MVVSNTGDACFHECPPACSCTRVVRFNSSKVLSRTFRHAPTSTSSNGHILYRCLGILTCKSYLRTWRVLVLLHDRSKSLQISFTIRWRELAQYILNLFERINQSMRHSADLHESGRTCKHGRNIRAAINTPQAITSSYLHGGSSAGPSKMLVEYTGPFAPRNILVFFFLRRG